MFIEDKPTAKRFLINSSVLTRHLKNIVLNTTVAMFGVGEHIVVPYMSQRIKGERMTRSKYIQYIEKKNVYTTCTNDSDIKKHKFIELCKYVVQSASVSFLISIMTHITGTFIHYNTEIIINITPFIISFKRFNFRCECILKFAVHDIDRHSQLIYNNINGWICYETNIISVFTFYALTENYNVIDTIVTNSKNILEMYCMFSIVIKNMI